MYVLVRKRGRTIPFVFLSLCKCAYCTQQSWTEPRVLLLFQPISSLSVLVKDKQEIKLTMPILKQCNGPQPEAYIKTMW